jgi:hypothetical protein
MRHYFKGHSCSFLLTMLLSVKIFWIPHKALVISVRLLRASKEIAQVPKKMGTGRKRAH